MDERNDQLLPPVSHTTQPCSPITAGLFHEASEIEQISLCFLVMLDEASSQFYISYIFLILTLSIIPLNEIKCNPREKKVAYIFVSQGKGSHLFVFRRIRSTGPHILGDHTERLCVLENQFLVACSVIGLQASFDHYIVLLIYVTPIHIVHQIRIPVLIKSGDPDLPNQTVAVFICLKQCFKYLLPGLVLCKVYRIRALQNCFMKQHGGPGGAARPKGRQNNLCKQDST